jgi:hypothetical protein
MTWQYEVIGLLLLVFWSGSMEFFLGIWVAAVCMAMWDAGKRGLRGLQARRLRAHPSTAVA